MTVGSSTWKRCLLGLFLGLVLPSVQAGSGPGPAYTLEDCLRIGLRRSGVLLNARRDREMAETVIGQVGAQVYPHAGAVFSYRRMDELQEVSFGEQRIELGALDQYAAGVNLRQLVYAGGSVRAALEAAKAFRARTDFQVQAVRSTLVRDIHAGFHDLLLLEAVVQVHEESLVLLEEILAQTRRRFEEEQVSEFEVMNARVQLDNARPDLIRAQNRLAVARNAFRHLLRLEEADFLLEGGLSFEPLEVDPEALMESALERRPDLEGLRRMVSMLALDIRAEQGGYRPAVHLTAAYTGEDPPSMLAAENGWDWHWYAGVQVSWDWLDGGLRRNKVRQKRLEHDKARETLDLLRRAVEQEVFAAFLSWEHAVRAEAASRENVALAERSLEIASTRYASGLATRLEYTEVQLALTRARLNRLQALRDHHKALNDLAYATGAYAAPVAGAGEEGNR